MLGGDPDGELGDSGKSTGDDEHIPSSEYIGPITGGQTAEETWGITVSVPRHLRGPVTWLDVDLPCGVEDGHQVLSHLLRHVRLLKTLHSQIVDGDEYAIGQDEDAQQQHDKRELSEGCSEVAGGHLLGHGLGSRADCEDCNDLQAEDEKGRSPHGPGVPGALDHATDHDGEDDAAD